MMTLPVFTTGTFFLNFLLYKVLRPAHRAITEHIQPMTHSFKFNFEQQLKMNASVNLQYICNSITRPVNYIYYQS